METIVSKINMAPNLDTLFCIQVIVLLFDAVLKSHRQQFDGAWFDPTRVSAGFYYTKVKLPNSYKFLRPFVLKGTYSICQLCPNLPKTYRSIRPSKIDCWFPLTYGIFKGWQAFFFSSFSRDIANQGFVIFPVKVRKYIKGFAMQNILHQSYFV